ncbi:dTDP-4-dehydrorhamnose 3,5-epimerase [Sphingomonas hengshuiensis]|uniref:dTDP-4-dehydrorhamnose 3,5-epimerase n=1 Tax=Sphingomonas hengshuiensis TaxID=1609977 RepID=A0A7U4JBR7_9SPHN|nr:dTDP-4-dehydrorhamnose 3,5-epimerase [Sphingomonas hengshuiensis]AJP73905.1 dTDP-4-dehydrorhamnose 3,5-epimerase [Sphingomonas hengshuiensis]
MISQAKLLEPTRYFDDRGWFMEIYSEEWFGANGIHDHFHQDHHSYFKSVGTIRGIHFQMPPFAQAKLVRCVRGSILNVAVDLRRGSPAFARPVVVELSDDDPAQFYIPIGFGHGFMTLEPDTEVLYKISNKYSREFENGIRWDDPTLAIEWPLTVDPIISRQDWDLPTLAEFESPFVYGEEARGARVMVEGIQ